MKKIKIFIPVLSILLLASCKKGGVFCYNGNGEVITETRTTDNFNEIELATQGNVYITQSNNYDVKIETSSNLMDVLQTKVVGQKLVLGNKKNKCIKGDEEINFYISTPKINGLIISGSGNVFVEDGLVSDNFKLKISGSGDIEANHLEVNKLDAIISGSGSITTQSNNTLQSTDLKINGSGNINMFDSPANKVNVDISGSGSCYVNVIDDLKVNISGSGDVIYIGQPAINSNISGSGDIRPY